MESFITGSRAYGKATSKSDVDLVIRCSVDTENRLRKLSDNATEVVALQGDTKTKPIRFGKLNLIVCTTDEQFAVWRLGTTSMQMEIQQGISRSFNKADAKEVFDVLRGMIPLRDEGDDSGDGQWG